MKKQLIKNIQTVQQFQNVQPLTKSELHSVKGGTTNNEGNIVVEDEIDG